MDAALKSIPSRLTLLSVFLFFALAVLLQWRSGAFQGEFGSFADEPAHFITGLMVRDYAASLAPAPPMEYAVDYYLHYPKVGLGHWPPFFYLYEAAWTLLFPPSQVSVMLMMALLSALLAATVSRIVAAEYNLLAGLAAGTWLLTVPWVQSLGRAVMAELLVALLCLLALVCWGRYLDSARWQDAAGYGLLASVAFLTKGSAIVLPVAAVVSTVLARRTSLTSRPSFWLPALLVICICGPWYLLAPGAMHEIPDNPDGTFAAPSPMAAMIARTRKLTETIGLLPMLLLLAGLLDRILLPLWRGQRVSGRWAALLGLIVSFPVTAVAVLPLRNTRHLVLVVPPVAILAIAGAAFLFTSRPLRTVPHRWRIGAAALTLATLIGMNIHDRRRVLRRGFSKAAEHILADPSFRNSVLLVSAPGASDGMFISEIARREHRPGHIVLRANQVIANSTWMNQSYQLRHQSLEELREYLRSVPVGLIILDRTSPKTQPHQEQLVKLIDTYPGEWRLVGSFEAAGFESADRGIAVYQHLGHEECAKPHFRIDMQDRLGRVLEY